MSASPAASEARNGLSGTTVGSGVDANGGAAFVNRAFESYERPANGGDVAKTVYPSYGSAVWKEDSQDAVKPSKPKAAEGCWEKLKRDAWLLPLVHSEFWISAAFSLIQPFYPILVSARH
ncbi:hypothetical protein V5799_005082 [Amblyomma americanum]|uniref:Uncharacterized protein n=1 Tax=Amblyomma americanum TaxID=6943 RepID=A0AAQ4E097_AMBAM